MLVRNLEIRSYEDAGRLLRGKEVQQVCNNTSLCLDKMRIGSNSITVVLHGHSIVEWHPNSVHLYSCGYRTVTTKDRMNRCIPKEYSVYQEKGQWWVMKSTVDPDDGVTPWIQRREFWEGMNPMTAFDGVVSETE